MNLEIFQAVLRIVGAGGLLGFLLATLTAVFGDELTAQVIVVANSASAESLEVANRYIEARGIPKENIIALSTSQEETITWREFVDSIWIPLEDQLVARKWIDGVPMKLRDAADRKKYFVSGHRIAFLVTCRGIPLRIKHEPALYKSVPPQTDNAFFRTNAGAVDGELALLAEPNHEINGYVRNPLFDDDRPPKAELARVIKVARLDGPTVEDAISLCDRAIEAERTGLIGRAYVDVGGIHPDGDRWLNAAADQLVALGFETTVDRASTTFPATAVFESPVLYFGWYAPSLNGPFAVPGFRFPAGAIAMHIHSFSAATLRNPQTGWCGPLIARGVTATVGNVYEPYLQLTHRPDLLLRALARGENFGDAACYAQPALSWQVIAIGDPLYRPFKQVARKNRTASQ